MVLAVGVLELVREPVEALIEAVPTCGARRLDVPVAVAQRVQTQFICYLRCIHRIWQILKKKIIFSDCPM